MTRRRPGFTRRQHVDLGAQLQEHRDGVYDAVTAISNAYGDASRAARLAHRALNAIDALRCELDNLSAGELPGDLWPPTIYYGANRDARAAWLAENPLTDD